MVFDTDSNKVLRGAGNGVPIALNAAVAVDSNGSPIVSGTNGVPDYLSELNNN